MNFSQRLKEARLAAGLTQQELGKLADLTSRTIQNYETGTRRPQKIYIVDKLAEVLHTTREALVSGSDVLILEGQKFGSKAACDIEKLVAEISVFFADNDIDDSEKDAIMAELNRAYWEAKTDNRKYATKKHRK